MRGRDQTALKTTVLGEEPRASLIGHDKDIELFLGVMETMGSMHIEEKSNRLGEREKRRILV